MKYLRRIKEITRRDSVRNEVVRQELKVEPILKTIHEQQLKWFGHFVAGGSFEVTLRNSTKQQLPGNNENK